MDKIIAFCGIICSECPAFMATQNDDANKRMETAKLWSKRYNADIKPEDINCEGCSLKVGKKFYYCNVCEIRKCGQENGVRNCAYCGDYICEKLNKLFKIAPAGKATLDAIKNGL